MDEEKEYKEQMEKEGIDMPEEKKEEEAPKEEDKKEEEQKEDKEEKEEKEKEKEDLPEPKEFKKRSIYDEYKDKKSELRESKNALEEKEKENEDLRTKLEDLQKADTPEKKEEALDELEEFAKEIGADPAAIKKMKKLFLKDYNPQSDESLEKDLADFKTWKAQNQKSIEKQAFDDEFSSILPQLKSEYPNASDEEMKSMRSKIDEIAHSKEFHNQTLDYIVFKNKEELSALVSPKKRGMETKERKDVAQNDFEFDPNADLNTLTPAQQDEWQKHYEKMTSSDELQTDSDGRKMII